jgi:hypothetical protein
VTASRREVKRSDLSADTHRKGLRIKRGAAHPEPFEDEKAAEHGGVVDGHEERERGTFRASFRSKLIPSSFKQEIIDSTPPAAAK